MISDGTQIDTDTCVALIPTGKFSFKLDGQLSFYSDIFSLLDRILVKMDMLLMAIARRCRNSGQI